MPALGDLLAGRYRLDAPLGTGGMATAWRALDLRLGRAVAVKVLRPEIAGDPIAAARFEREARALAAIADRRVVAIHDVVLEPPEPFLVMELCPEGSLGDRLDAVGRLAPVVALPLLADAAGGLAAIHAVGLLHRDVAPRNVLLAGAHAKLGDLGLARDGRQVEALTLPGTAVGTLAYLAPEILAGAPASAASDVYGLGAVAWRTVVGSPPGVSRSSGGDLATLVGGLPPDVSGALEAALDPDPARRPSAAGLAAILERSVRGAGTGAAEVTATVPARASGRGGGPFPAGSDLGARPVPPRTGQETGRSRPGRARAAFRGPPPGAAGPPGAGGPREPASPVYHGPGLWSGELVLILIVVLVLVPILLALLGGLGGGAAPTASPTG